MVCRAAWEPCRRCKGQARARKAEETMSRNGTTRPRGKKWDGFVYGTREAQRADD